MGQTIYGADQISPKCISVKHGNMHEVEGEQQLRQHHHSVTIHLPLFCKSEDVKLVAASYQLQHKITFV